MPKIILLALLTLAVSMSEASAQSRLYYRQFYGSATDSSDTAQWTAWRAIYDGSGEFTGSVATDSSGAVTNYTASGLLLNRDDGSNRVLDFTPGICTGFRVPPEPVQRLDLESRSPAKLAEIAALMSSRISIGRKRSGER
jgi:hypothetical protein